MKINNKIYKIPELNYNTICILEEMGISLTDMDKRVFSTVRGFVALAMNGDYEKAGEEIEEHLKNGGSLDEVLEEINKAVEESGFFQALNNIHKQKG